MMDEERSVTQAVRVVEPASTPTSQSSGGWWAAPAAGLLVVVCCAGPILLAALVASGAGGWLGTRGFGLAAVGLIIVAAVLAVGAWMRLTRG